MCHFRKGTFPPEILFTFTTCKGIEKTIPTYVFCFEKKYIYVFLGLQHSLYFHVLFMTEVLLFGSVSGYVV